MSEAITTREMIDRIVQQTGIRKKIATELLRALPEIIEQGLLRDGEVRVKGLGTFRLKWIKERVGRNPKTGEQVGIPPHNRLVFLPEKSLKEYINQDYRLLSYEVIDEHKDKPAMEPAISGPLSDAIPKERDIISPFPEAPPEETEPVKESAKPRRRVHWIVPVAIIIVAALSIIFYFRNFYEGEEEGQVAVGGQQSAVDSGQLAVDSGQLAVGETQHSELKTQNSELKTVSEGKRYFQLAREAYGNPFLWVLIFDANKEKSPNPDILVSGTDVIIPRIEGKPYNLTRNDSLAVSKGYTAVYEYYQGRNDPRADEFLRVAGKYKPK